VADLTEATLAALAAVALFVGGLLAAHWVAAKHGTSLPRISRGMPRRRK
jgi:hypothetical protein